MNFLNKKFLFFYFLLISNINPYLYACGCVDPYNAPKNAEKLKSFYDSADAAFAETVLVVNDLNKESIVISEANKVLLSQDVNLAVLKGLKGFEAVHKSIILKELR